MAGLTPKLQSVIDAACGSSAAEVIARRTEIEQLRAEVAKLESVMDEVANKLEENFGHEWHFDEVPDDQFSGWAWLKLKNAIGGR